MKNKFLYLFLFVVGALVSCDKEDEFIETPAPPQNTMTSTLPDGTTKALLQDDADQVFTELSWTPTDFSAGTIKYTIEVDKAGNNFMGAKDILTTEELTATLSVEQINNAIVNLGIEPGQTAEVELRVRAWVDYILTPGNSNAVKFAVAPYEVVFSPIYVIGDAQAWSLVNAAQLTSSAPGVYAGQAKFTTNGKFRFFDLPDWSSGQYGWSYFTGGTLPSELASGEDGDSNFIFTGISGEYFITVSLLTKTITLQPVGPPPPPSSLFIVTAQALDLMDAIELQGADDGSYQQTVMLEQNTKFRIFASRNWDAEKWVWGSFDTVDELLVNSGDDVSSFRFTGETGYYIVTVSLGGATIQLEPTEAPQQTLYLIGDPQGWSLEDAWAMRSLGDNTFEVTGTFNTDQIFRFFVAPDWNAEQYKWTSFTGGTVDTDLGDGGGGDSNFKFLGASGVYKITVSLSDKTITVEPVDAPKLYIIGEDQSWTLGNAVEMTWLGAGKFQATTNFTNNAIFRFFETPAWDAVQWGYNKFASGTIDSDLEDGGGGDSNFRFAGTTGSHTITVDINTQTIVVE